MTPRSLISSGKDLLARTLEASGVLWRQLDHVLDGHVAVLMYHRVLPEPGRDSFSSPGIIVTPETFDRHLGWIRTHLQPLTADEFGAIIDGARPAPRRGCLVTFDDGWYDNLAFALPALVRHQVPAIVFAATDFVGTTNCFWQERLARLLHAAWRKGPAAAHLMRRADAGSAQGLAEPQARIAIRDAITRLKALQPAEIATLCKMLEEGLSELTVSLPAGYGDDRFLSWSELGKLAESGLVTVGSHSTTHVPLTKLKPAEIAAELATSRERLQSRLSRKVEWFAYPNGDHDATSVDLVREGGYRGAFTTLDGPTAVNGDRFTLRRINIHESATRTLGRFFSRIAGVL